MTNDNMVKLMQMSMDELEKLIAERKQTLQFMEDVFALRKRAGECTTKQRERRQKRQAKSQSVTQLGDHNENGVS